MFHRIVLWPPKPTPTILSMEAIIALSNDCRDMAKLNQNMIGRIYIGDQGFATF